MVGDSYVAAPPQRSLWEPSCSTSCSLWHACGGSPTAAPCGCIYTDRENRYDCENCDIVCRSRRYQGELAPPEGAEGQGFKGRIKKGQVLEFLALEQPSAVSELPPLIPYDTSKLRGADTEAIQWAAVSARQLFTNMKATRPARCSGFLHGSPDEVRRYLGVPNDTRLIALLNGRDRVLEGFWGMNRWGFYEALEHAGFWGVTGPTFSVNEESQRHPASHNVHMLQRHHRVIEETNCTSLVAVPNVYWRGEYDRSRLVEWLCSRTAVTTISMDVSRTSSWAGFYPPFRSLLDLVDQVNRQLHVVMVGVGRVKAGEVVKILSHHDATASVMTSDPVNDGSRGWEWEYRGPEPIPRTKNLDVPKPALSMHNITVMQRHLRDIATHD